jgi:serine/threonine-protein kinase
MIGRGGVGQVWAATRVDDVRMRVAIKLLRPDREGDEDFRRRFRAEMQILALMRHPNIVTFLDAGTTREGQPYFAMEYVEGEPITHFCNQRRRGAAAARLFLQVCEAVGMLIGMRCPSRSQAQQHPGDPGGSQKLLDFDRQALRPEILGEADVFTRRRPLTTEYASPEQLRAPYQRKPRVFAGRCCSVLTNRSPFSRGVDRCSFKASYGTRGAITQHVGACDR